MKRRFVLLPVLLWACVPLQAHNPDTSYLRCRVTPRELELRFTLGLPALYRIVRPDTDGDGKITRAEMEAATADVYQYLESAMRLEINGEPVALGERQGLGWPEEVGAAVAEKDYHGLLLHFTFRRPSPGLIEDFYVLGDVFTELGDGHQIIADIEQDGKHQEVVFTQLEPDYLYDTFWRGTGSFKEGISLVWGNGWVVGCLSGVALLSFRSGTRRGALGVLAVPLVGGAVGLWGSGGGGQRSLGMFTGSALAVAVWLPILFVIGRRRRIEPAAELVSAKS
jgi:hypothetical protein